MVSVRERRAATLNMLNYRDVPEAPCAWFSVAAWQGEVGIHRYFVRETSKLSQVSQRL